MAGRALDITRRACAAALRAPIQRLRTPPPQAGAPSLLTIYADAVLVHDAKDAIRKAMSRVRGHKVKGRRAESQEGSEAQRHTLGESRPLIEAKSKLLMEAKERVGDTRRGCTNMFRILQQGHENLRREVEERIGILGELSEGHRNLLGTHQRLCEREIFPALSTAPAYRSGTRADFFKVLQPKPYLLLDISKAWNEGSIEDTNCILELTDKRRDDDPIQLGNLTADGFTLRDAILVYIVCSPLGPFSKFTVVTKGPAGGPQVSTSSCRSCSTREAFEGFPEASLARF